MNRSTRAMLLLCAFDVNALAAPVTVPAGWTRDAAMSEYATSSAKESFRAYGRTVQVELDNYVAPASRTTLFITRTSEEIAAGPGRDALAKATLDEIAEAAERHNVVVNASTQRWIPEAKVLEARLRSSAPDTKLGVAARTLVAATATRVVAITGECYLGETTTADETACLAALETLEVDLALAERTELPPPSTAPAPSSTAPEPPQVPTAPMREQPSMGGGAHTPMTPMTISPAKREIDRRPLYLGGGIVVLAALFWWNRRRRDLFDREDGVTPAKPVDETTSGDDDADDLQAAARGDAKDES